MLAFRSWVLAFLTISLWVCSVFSYAGEDDFGYRVFEIQKKFALKGSRLAQYKLGTFYEFGISVKPNPQEAIAWYKKSASKNSKQAKNRLLYLDIKLNGYKKAKHDSWVAKIKDEASSGNIHSIIILGQLNHYGMGVKKDLKQALNLLGQASSRGYAEIDFEIDEILKQTGQSAPKSSAPIKSTAMKQKKKSKPIAVVVKSAAPVKAKVISSTSKSKLVEKNAVPNKSVVKIKSKSKSKEEKELIRRKRYVEAMRKQYEEQLLLQQQQQWSEDEE